MRIQVRDLAPGQNYAIQFRANSGEDVSEWSQIQRFTTTNDTYGPSPVTNLTFYDSGKAFTAKWDGPTTDELNQPLKDFRHYRCTLTSGSTSVDFFETGESFTLSADRNIATFGTFKSDLSLTVRAVDLTYNESDPVTATASPANPPTPSVPHVDNFVGALLVEWDGRDSLGALAPANVEYCEVHVSTSATFTPDATTLKAKIAEAGKASSTLLTGTELVYDTTYYVKFILVNALGKKSAASAYGQGTYSRLSGLDVVIDQIAADQINFTARDIGGANAYYKTSQPIDGVDGTLATGDIWYDTDDKYTTYRYNKTTNTWTAAPEIGQIVGTKILAGTLTADAVGTNLLITNKANIGTAVIDSASISSLNAAKITTGIMKSSLNTTVNGASVPVWQIDLAGNATFNNGTFRGTVTGSSIVGSSYKTSSLTTDRRIEMGIAGLLGEINFYSGDGDKTFVRSYTESSGLEAIQFGVSAGRDGLWNRINYNSQGYSNYRSWKHEFVFTTNDTAPYSGDGFWHVLDNDRSNSEFKERLKIDSGGTWSYYPTGGWHNVYSQNPDGTTYQRTRINDTSVYFSWDRQNAGYLDFGNLIRADTSPFIGMILEAGYGSKIYHRSSTTGASARIEFVNEGANAYRPLWASAFTVSSAQAGKREITDYEGGALAKLKTTKVKKYRRKVGNVVSGEKPDRSFPKETKGATRLADKAPNEVPANVGEEILGPVELGLIAEEAPSEIVIKYDDGSGPGIDLYQMNTMLLAALQELAAEVDNLKRGRP